MKFNLRSSHPSYYAGVFSSALIALWKKDEIVSLLRASSKSIEAFPKKLSEDDQIILGFLCYFSK